MNISFYPRAQIDCPQTIESRSTLHSTLAKLPRIAPSSSARFLVGWCLWLSGWEPSKAMTKFMFDLYFPSIRFNSKPNTKWEHLPTCSSLVTSSLQRPSHCLCWLFVGCCIPPSNGSHLRLTHPPSLYFFFAPFTAPNNRITSSPRIMTRHRLFLKAPLASTLPTIGWLLGLKNKRRPPKANASPISQLIHASQRRRHELVASPLYPWRENGKVAGSR